MDKIPLERTIGDTCRFAFSIILSIFGIAWLQLGHGNFWRIAALFIACVFGPMIVISMVQIVVMPFMGSALLQIQQAGPDHRVLTPQQMWTVIGPALHNFLPFWIVFEAITLPIVFGLQNAVSAFAYRNLAGAEAPAV